MKMSSLIPALCIVAGLATTALPASADHRSSWRDDYRGRQGGVVLYADPGFTGEARQFDDAVPSLGRMGFNDRVSSIEIRSGAWEVCVDGNFRGRCEIISSSNGYLKTIGLNDNISSLRPVGYDRGRDRYDRRGGQGLILFPDPRQQGRPVEIDQDVPALGPYGFNDRASSFIVTSGTWQVCEHANYRGRCTILTAGAGDLRTVGMNDNISSIRRYGGWR